jgi:hypothetical protein
MGLIRRTGGTGLPNTGLPNTGLPNTGPHGTGPHGRGGWRRRSLAVASAVTVITFAAGFASIGPQGAGYQSPGYRLAASRQPLRTAAQPGVPRAGSRAEAAAVAARTFGVLVLSRGAVRLPQRPLPRSLSEPGQRLLAFKYLDEYRLYRLPMTMTKAFAFLRTHVPAGTVLQSTGRDFDRHGTTMEIVAFVPRKLWAGIYAVELVESLVPGGSGTALLRADAQVIWFPARSAAEYVTPSKIGSVRITSDPAGGTVTVTSPRFIRAVADVLNGLNAAPSMPPTCPLRTVAYQVTLVGKSSGQPALVVATEGCRVDVVTLGALSQPSLWDPGNELYALAGAQMHKARPKAQPPAREG